MSLNARVRKELLKTYRKEKAEAEDGVLPDAGMVLEQEVDLKASPQKPVNFKPLMDKTPSKEESENTKGSPKSKFSSP